MRNGYCTGNMTMDIGSDELHIVSGWPGFISIQSVLICFEKEIIERVGMYAEDRVENSRFCGRIGGD